MSNRKPVPAKKPCKSLQPGIHPAANLLPMLVGDDLKQLAEDIRVHGLQTPIVLLDGKVLDGRNRLAACAMAGIKPRFTTLSSDDVKDPLSFVMSANLHRRHLTTSQRALIAAEAAALIQSDAAARQRAGLKTGKQQPVSANRRERVEVSHGGKTSDVVGKQFGVGGRSVDRAKAVLEGGSADLIAAVRSGAVKLDRAEQIIREVPPTHQMEEHELNKRRPKLRQLVRAALTDGKWREISWLFKQIRVKKAGVSNQELEKVLAGLERRPPAEHRLERDGTRLRLRSEAPVPAAELHVQTFVLLDRLDAIATTDKARMLYPDLQPLSLRLRETLEEVIEAVAIEAVQTQKVPVYIRPAASSGRRRRRLLLRTDHDSTDDS
jgi:ParB-like chromosome segregation protein Spo0J